MKSSAGLLRLEQASLAFGHVPLLDQVDFQLDAGERVALIGRNGTGKSSFLAVLAGERTLDDGLAWRQPGLRVAHVPQEPGFSTGETVFAAVLSGLGETARGLREYHALTHRLETADAADAPALLMRLQTVQHALEAEGAWNWRTEVDQMITRFGLSPEALAQDLSGGQKKRLALARALVMAPDVLLLDEPTNHLDIAAIEWLEALLLERRATLCFVTHDRRFLERLATRIVELDRGCLTRFPGDFAYYQRRKEAMLAEERLSARKEDRLLEAEEAWIRKGVEARRTRAVSRIARLERLRAERLARRERLDNAKIRLASGEKSGELVVDMQNVEKTLGSRMLVRDFSTRILRGDKVGLIGPNGAGKTTLLRLILGELPPDRGTLRRGTRLSIAYFDQFRAQLDLEAPLTEVISPGSDFVEIAGRRKHVIGYLEDFLFAPERARSPVGTLSGGERNRLLLARLFARPANVLVLDEPTNDLDMETLELLEALLQDYDGTLFLVSHDRAFLDHVVTQTIAAEGDGFWREQVGGYSDWAAGQAHRIRQEKPATPSGRKPEKKRAKPEAPEKPDRLTWKEARELEALPERIDTLEAEQRALTQQLETPSFHQNPEAARAVAERLATLEEDLTALLERWELLESYGRQGSSP
jgi:ATP-binding cassette subfamily F protein uup